MNKRIIVNRQKRRKRRQMMIRNILRVTVPTVLLSLLICFLIWKFVLPGKGSGGSADESQQDESQQDESRQDESQQNET